MSEKLHLSVSPHIHASCSISSIMLDVIISLLPALIAGCVIFGLRALLVVAVCVLGCVASELIFNLILKRKNTLSDLSAVVTGLILGLNLYANTPLWQAAVGSVFAIIIVKCFFGGIGHNVVNPAATARVFMLLAFSSMTSAALPLDASAGATPLVLLKEGNTPDLLNLFLGNHGGSIGETCALALLLGGIYLIAKRVISWHIPVAVIGSVFVFTLLANGFDANVALAAVLSGGLFLAAFFMATDYVTSPDTVLGKLIFGILIGFVTFAIRQWGSYPEGVSYAILLANILNPYIESCTARRIFGVK